MKTKIEITEKSFLEYVKNSWEFVKQLREIFPEHWIGTVTNSSIEFDDYKKGFFDYKVPVGLFKCPNCSCIVDHQQWAYSRCCAACDCGNKPNAQWKVYKNPEHLAYDSPQWKAYMKEKTMKELQITSEEYDRQNKNES